MNQAINPAAIAQTVVWGGLVIGIALGAVAQATRFCTMGALADWFTFGGRGRLMMWLLAVAVAATATMALVAAGWLDAARTLYWSERLPWLSCAVGGAVFGFGMVLASGCPQRNLVRAGSGSLKAWVSLLVVAIAAQMTLRGMFAAARVQGLDSASVQLGHPQDLGSMLAPLLGSSAGTARAGVLALLLAVAAWQLWRSRAQIDAGQWLGGALVGLLVPVAWALTGHWGYIAENPETLEPAWLGTYSHRPEALSFAAPAAHSLDLLTLWSDRNNVATFGVTLTLGVLLGSAASALWRREFRVESFADARDLGNHLAGGMLMGFGGVTALGCSIGQGLSGLSLLSAGACIAMAGIAGGAWAALKLQAWRLDREVA